MEQDKTQKIYETAKLIFTNERLTWEEKFAFIFSDNISKQVHFDYYDPDTSYEEDVISFMDGFDEYMAHNYVYEHTEELEVIETKDLIEEILNRYNQEGYTSTFPEWVAKNFIIQRK